MKRRIVAFIPVRGGSKSIPLKNIRMFCGKPLVYWTVKAAAEASSIDDVYVATDSDIIASTVNSFGFPNVHVIGRNPDTASDTASTESAMIEFALSHEFDDIILIQATSPLLEASDLEAGTEKYSATGSASCLSVVRQKRFIWQETNGAAQAVNYEPSRRPRRQEWEGYFVENGAFYITSRKNLIETGVRVSDPVCLSEMKEESYFEIDELSDWVIAEGLKKMRPHSEAPIDLSRINLLICDIDGVLTDAGMYYSTDGSESKKFNTKDGMGIGLVRKKGVSVMFLTSEKNRIIEDRAKKLSIDFLHMGIKDKKKTLTAFFEQNSTFSAERSAYIGDDINDLDAMKEVFFSAAPADASEVIRDNASYVCTRLGGQGCVREVCDLLIKS